MTTIDDVLTLDRGARFYRGDLHIHSYGASHDVTDPATTPTAIVQTAHGDPRQSEVTAPPPAETSEQERLRLPV